MQCSILLMILVVTVAMRKDNDNKNNIAKIFFSEYYLLGVKVRYGMKYFEYVSKTETGIVN